MSRRFLQIHLSTLIVLSLVSGALLWANMRGHEPDGFKGFYMAFGVPAGYGWPMMAREETVFDIFEMRRQVKAGVFEPYQLGWHWPALACNVAVALGTLIATALLLEWRIRRRKGGPAP
ncbi:MAG TPA: hypothetical protein VGP72_13935 [Planctomycetota bacterium]|jgi:hypothetical protein